MGVLLGEIWFGSAQKVRCNSIKGSLRVALVSSSLPTVTLYTGRSPMCIQVQTVGYGVHVYWGGIEVLDLGC